MEAKEKGEKWGLRSKREMVDNKTESRTGLLNFMSYIKKRHFYECFLFCPFPSNNLVTSTLRKYKFGQKDIDK